MQNQRPNFWNQLVRFRLKKGHLLLCVSGYWFIYCYYAGTFSDALVSKYIIPALFTIWLLSMIREIFFFAGALVDKRERTKRIIQGQSRAQALPKVSVIVPAYNEEDSIAASFQSILSLNYPNLQVIFVDDGSIDRTIAIVSEVANQFPQVDTSILVKPNGGKASALNFGLSYAHGEFVLCVDSDSKLDPDALLLAVQRFEDPEVGAVGGFVSIASLKNMLLRFQQLEYQLGLNFPRRWMSLFGSVTVVPGPVGLFRRSALQKIGGYSLDKNNFAEDAELTLRLLADGWKIHSDEDMIAYTEGPETLDALLRQRYRWVRGMYQAVQAQHRALSELRSFRGRSISLHLLFESTALPIFNMGLMIFFLSRFFHSGVADIIAIYLLYMVAIDICRISIATHREGDKFSWLFFAIVEKPLYSFLLQTWAILSLMDEWRQEEMTWDKLARSGQLKTEVSP